MTTAFGTEGVPGAVFMCRKNELLGSILMALGAGLLLSLLFSSELILAALGIGLLLCGLLWAQRRSC